MPSVWTLAGGALLLATLALHEVALWHLRSNREAQRKRTLSVDATSEPAKPAKAHAEVPSEPLPRGLRPSHLRASHGAADLAAEDAWWGDERVASDVLGKTPSSPSIGTVGV